MILKTGNQSQLKPLLAFCNRTYIDRALSSPDIFRGLADTLHEYLIINDGMGTVDHVLYLM